MQYLSQKGQKNVHYNNLNRPKPQQHQQNLHYKQSALTSRHLDLEEFVVKKNEIHWRDSPRQPKNRS